MHMIKFASGWINSQYVKSMNITKTYENPDHTGFSLYLSMVDDPDPFREDYDSKNAAQSRLEAVLCALRGSIDLANDD